jgi:hypothetical protein
MRPNTMKNNKKNKPKPADLRRRTYTAYDNNKAVDERDILLNLLSSNYPLTVNEVYKIIQ